MSGFLGNFIGATNLGINDQTGTSYTFVRADQDKDVRCNNAGAITLTMPPNTFPIGAQTFSTQVGAGAFTATAGAGVTLNGELVSNGQWAGCVWIQVALNVWDIHGDMTT